jgi:hypothetical protein
MPASAASFDWSISEKNRIPFSAELYLKVGDGMKG